MLMNNCGGEKTLRYGQIREWVESIRMVLADGELYDVETDVSELWDVADGHPDLIAELTELAGQLDARITAEARPVRTVDSKLFEPAAPEQQDG